jgi:large subunit ribosomal protein L21
VAILEAFRLAPPGHAELIAGAGGGERRDFERSHMYAVIKTGGKQYKVAAGEKIKVEQIAADVGQEIVIEQVLAVGNGADLKVGTPWVAGASVKATVLAHGKHDKVRIFKMRRRKHYQKHGGHRQNYTELQIGSVNA